MNMKTSLFLMMSVTSHINHTEQLKQRTCVWALAWGAKWMMDSFWCKDMDQAGSPWHCMTFKRVFSSSLGTALLTAAQIIWNNPEQSITACYFTEGNYYATNTAPTFEQTCFSCWFFKDLSNVWIFGYLSTFIQSWILFCVCRALMADLGKEK